MSAPQRPRVLMAVFGRIPSPSGLSAWIGEEIETLIEHYDLDILSLKTDELAHIERFHGARLLRVPVAPGPLLNQVKTFQRALSRQLDSEDYSLCHFFNIWEGLVLASRKSAFRYKLVCEIHSLPSVDFRATHAGEEQVVEQSYPLMNHEDICLNAADRVLVGSELLRGFIAQRGIPPLKLQLLRPALDPTLFDKVDSVPRQPGTVVYLGSLKPWQGVPSLLMALAELPRQLPVKLVLVAPREEPWAKEIQGKIQILGLARKVELVDPIPLPSLWQILGRADVCLAPLGNHDHNRLAASTSHKLLCYMAARRAVVASRQPAVLEVLENETHGLLYPPGDIPALAEAIRKLLTNRDQADRLGAQGRHHLEEHLGLEAARGHLLSAYFSLLGEPKVPGITRRQAADHTPVTTKLVASEETQPRFPQPPVFAAQRDQETQTIPLPSSPRPAVEVDTRPEPPPSPEPREIIEEVEQVEMVFFPAEDDEVTPPPKHQEHWQVMELKEVCLPEAEEKTPRESPHRPAPPPAPPPERQAEGEAEEKTPSARHRWLLGGPPFPVPSEATPPAGIEPIDPQAASAGEPPLLSGDDLVEIDVDIADPDKTPPPLGRKK